MKKHYHLVGINGIGVSGVARILLEMGYTVSGSDPCSSFLTDKLKEMGAKIFHQHNESNIEGADCLVLSSAIMNDNPEIIAAKKLGIPIFHRAEVLGHIMKNKVGAAVSGTHGKTTTSAMMTNMFDYNNLDPTFFVGGQLNGLMSNARLGKSPYMVVEADESDESFLFLDPRWIVVTSVDVDVNLNVAPFSHLNFDHEKTLIKVKESFYKFIDKLPANGRAILCIDDQNVREMIPYIDKPYITYGLSKDAQIRAENIVYKNFGSTYDVFLNNDYLGTMSLKVPGLHNVQNALAVTAIGLELNLRFEDISASLFYFGGVKRRFQILSFTNDIMVVDDYAHNPGKVRALLSGAKTGGRSRVITIFQPHRFTRTKFLFNEFAESFKDTDILIVTEIYDAKENPILGTKGENLAAAIQNNPNCPKEVHFIPHCEDVVEYTGLIARPGDLIITCGAGDIYKTGEILAEKLSDNRTLQELVAV